MNEIADRRLTQRRSAFAAVVADATQPAPRPPSELSFGSGAPGGGDGAYDLVLISYLHLPRSQWGEALAAAVRATVVGGVVLVVVHAVRNLTAGVGGPQDPTILLDPEDVVASGAELPVDVELAQLRARDVDGCGPAGTRHGRAVPQARRCRRLSAGTRSTNRSKLSRRSRAGLGQDRPIGQSCPVGLGWAWDKIDQ